MCILYILQLQELACDDLSDEKNSNNNNSIVYVCNTHKPQRNHPKTSGDFNFL